jgi:hypothetical protein
MVLMCHHAIVTFSGALVGASVGGGALVGASVGGGASVGAAGVGPQPASTKLKATSRLRNRIDLRIVSLLSFSFLTSYERSGKLYPVRSFAPHKARIQVFPLSILLGVKTCMPFITLPQIPHHLLSKSSGIVSGNDTGMSKKEN